MEEATDLKIGLTLKELTVSGLSDGDEVAGCSSTLELQDLKLVCVEYPAIIASVDKMLHTLGGELTMSKTYAHPNLRLELRYRPADPFCHFLCGNRYSSNNLLLKVRRRVRKKDNKVAEVNMEILGVIGTTYKFQGMADYQCLAVHSQDGKHASLYDKIILRKPEKQEFFEQPMPYFIPPAIFSRLDSPVDYFYRPDVNQKLQGDVQNKANFIGLNRVRRSHNAVFISFADPSVPSECMEAAKTNWTRMCLRDNDRQAEEKLAAMFESRPIWSRNAVKANINIHPEKLKLLLPVFAYYMVTGPWRSLWIKFGYDPRRTIESKKYQMLDYRMRCSTKNAYVLSDLPVKPKRSALNYTLPIAINKTVPTPASVTDLPTQEGSGSSRDQVRVSYQLKESSYVFKEGMLPPHRQMFYQLCDLEVQRIQDVIQQNSGTEQVCDERDGWCTVGTTDKLRDIISAMVKKVIRELKPPLQKMPKRPGSSVRSTKAGAEDAEDDDYDDDVKAEDEEDEYQPSEGSENEMETEILDYI
nr:general transcription factor 3C polypeptide 5-like [Nerophis lumbriciformis]